MRALLGPAGLAAVVLLHACRGASDELDRDRPHLRFETPVRAILEDTRGRYWFGSWNEGVAMWDGQTLTYYTVDDGLADDQVRSILEDEAGWIWFECGEGVSYFDGERLRVHTARDYTSRSRWSLQPNDLWFKADASTGVTPAEGEPGVYRYDGADFVYQAFPLPAEREDDAFYSVTGITRSQAGRLWISTYGAIFGFDGQSVTRLDNRAFGLTEATGFLHARCVFEDRRERVWVGNNGIGVLLREEGTTTLFTQEMGVGRRDTRSGGELRPQPGDVDSGGASMHRVFSIGEDRNGHIWFGTAEQGAWRYDDETLRQFTALDGLTTPAVLVVYRDRRGDLWLGGDGVFRREGVRFERVF